MKQQGVIFLAPDKLLLYQVSPSSAEVKLAPRGVSGGGGNFSLTLKVLSVEDGLVLGSASVITSGEISRVVATRAGAFVVQAGAALYSFSSTLQQTAFRSLVFEKAAPVENWRIQASPSGEKLVLLHEQIFMPAELLADNTIIHDGRAKVEVSILDSVTLQPQASFTLAHSLSFWAPAEDFLLSSNPEHSYSDGTLGTLDFAGRWSEIRSDLPKEQHFCRYALTPVDSERSVFFGCDWLSVFSSSGKTLYAATGPGCFFSSASTSGASASATFVALECDHYSTERLTQRSLMVSAPRPDRIEVYDLDRHARIASIPVHRERVAYAVSQDGSLAIVDGPTLRVFVIRVKP